MNEKHKSQGHEIKLYNYHLKIIMLIHSNKGVRTLNAINSEK